jgi:hypothetical protein
MNRNVRTGASSVFALMLLWIAPVRAIELPPDAQVQTIHPGAWSFEIIRPEVPLAIYGFYWDLNEPRLALQSTTSDGRARGLAPLSRHLEPLHTGDQRPVAAVNADFYVVSGPFSGSTVGPFVVDGRLMRIAVRPLAFAQLADRRLYIGGFKTTLSVRPQQQPPFEVPGMNIPPTDRGLTMYTADWGQSTNSDAAFDADAEVEVVEVPFQWERPLALSSMQVRARVVGGPVSGRGDHTIPRDGFVLSAIGDHALPLRRLRAGEVVTVELQSQPDLPVRQLVGGAPVLVSEGRIAYEPGDSEPRHPRTAVGFSRTHGIALIVDGRAPGHSRGMTLPEMAELMQELRCTDAINLDGGGSSTCWVRGEILNVPSDGRERSIANGLALMSHAPLGPPARITFDPPGPIKVAQGGRVEIQTQITDQLYNPLPSDGWLNVRLSRTLGTWDGEAFEAHDTPGATWLVAQAGRARGELDVEVVDRIDRLVVRPAEIRLLPGERQEIEVTAKDEAGQTVYLHYEMIEIELPGGLGARERMGVRAGEPGSRGEVAVSAFGRETAVPMAVAAPRVVEDFEREVELGFNGIPGDVTGEVQRLRGDAAQGAHFARLTYGFPRPTGTQAAYLRLGRRIDNALALRAMVRGDGQRVRLRAMVADGLGSPHYLDLHNGGLEEQWQRVEAKIPPGLRTPLTLQSVYVVRTGDAYAREGHIDWDVIEVMTVGE